MFDVLDPEYSTKLVLDFDDEEHAIQSDRMFGQMVDTGYESYNSILNLGSLSVFFFFYFVRVLFCLLLWLFVKIKKTKKW